MTPLSPRKVSAHAGAPPAFSLVELVIVVVIISVVSVIAIPRFSSAASTASDNTLLAQTNQFQQAIDLYTAEHAQLTPVDNADGSRTRDPSYFVKRLLLTTDSTGEFAEGLGPYLRQVPINPFNRNEGVEIDDGTPGDNSHGWFYNSSLGLIIPDDPRGFALFKAANGDIAYGKPDLNPGDVKPVSAGNVTDALAVPVGDLSK
jgi:prepilin-type N-terminal cleavage/methylation domain-containing protein